MPRRLIALAAASVAALALAGCGSAGLGDEARLDVAPVEDRTPAPAFRLRALDGGAPVTLAAYRGTPVVVNYWASWCAPCREEMPALAAFARANPGVKVLGIAINDEPADSRRFVKKVRADYDHAIDQPGDVAQRYGVAGLPTTVVVDAEGRIATTWPGPIERADLERITARLSE
ncbi:MAG: TlpA family protein disulfide reductase [Thermoleophilia bacterium]|jgi:peroxiredoxin|nr:TlpA family protein disulfide reductase [Thermoleophilia bacterium]